MKLTIKAILLPILLASWSPAAGQNALEPDTLGLYSIHGYVYNQQYLPLGNVRASITNWENEYAGITDQTGYFTIQFPVEKEDYQYNRQVHIELYSRELAYLRNSMTIPVRQFQNGEYVIEATRLNTRRAPEAAPAVDWGLIDSLQSEIDSLRNLLNQYPERVDSLEARIAELQQVRDEEFREYVVQPGDYLIKIASDSQFYDDPYSWRIIYDANRQTIEDPNLIYPKQVLKIPAVSENKE